MRSPLHRPGMVLAVAPALALALLAANPAGAAAPPDAAASPGVAGSGVVTADGVAPNTLTKAGYVLSNGNTGTIDLIRTDASKESPARVPGDNPIVVSLGDSYISGEAGRWAGNSVKPAWSSYSDAGGPNAYSDYRGAEALPECHRSTSAEINIPGNDVASVNLACSGATTSTAADAKIFKPGVDFTDTNLTGGAKALGQAKLLENLAASNPGRVQMVVLSIGGNDFNFGSIVETCLTAYLFASTPCSRNPDVLANFTPENITSRQAAILGAIDNVLLAMSNAKYTAAQWSLVVQTYPSPIAGKDTIRYPETYARQFDGGCGLYNTDLDWANDYALKTINDTVSAAVVQARTETGPRIVIMDLSDALKGHRLCENNTNMVGPLAWYPIYGYVMSPVENWKQVRPAAVDLSEWVAQIRVQTVKDPEGALPYVKAESLHPNWWGQKAIGACLIQAWNTGNGVRGGACVYGGPGLVNERPVMTLQSTPGGNADDGPAPSKVRNLDAKARATGVVTVSWDKPASGKVVEYQYRLRKGDGDWQAWMDNGMSRSATLSVLVPGPSYTVQVRAVSSGGKGPAAAESFRVPS